MDSRLGILFVVFFVVIGLAYYYFTLPTSRVEEPVSGRQVYSRNCAGCHGTSGKGNGPAAEYLFPKPRDFTSGVYKFTSTPNGELPTDKDLKRVISEGLSPGGMPGFGNVLSDKQIARVTDYIKSFSDKFKKQDVPDPISVPEPPKQLLTQNRVEEGKKLYDKLGCRSCHGPEGKGKGPSADQQQDHWGEPIPPRDLTRGNYKGGKQLEDIYTRIMTGITGTGMPPYSGALKNESERWAIVSYVKSLSADSQTPKSLKQPSDALLVKSVNQDKEALKNPLSTVWEKSNRTRLPLYSLWLTDRTPFDSVEVRALHNGEQLAVWMRWQDPTKNMKPAEVTDYTDAGAVMFPDLAGAVPFLGMGDAKMRGGMAHIWHWRANDQLAVNRGGPSVDREDRFPTMQVDYYPQKESYEPGTLTKFENLTQHTKNQPRLFQSGWATSNPLSQPVVKSPVKSYRAKGFGTLTALDAKKTRTDGRGVYRNGEWRIVMFRPLKTETAVAQFQPGSQKTAAFAVWDGEQRDRNGQKDITSWITLQLEKK